MSDPWRYDKTQGWVLVEESPVPPRNSAVLAPHIGWRYDKTEGWVPSEAVDPRNGALEPYRKWLYAMAYAMAPTWGQVDDVAQEGYIAMWRSLETFDPARGTLAKWLTRNAKQRMGEYLRRGAAYGKQERRGVHTKPESAGYTQVSLNALMEDGYDVEGADDVPAMVAEAYMVGTVRQALATLTDQQRKYVVLRFWHGKTERQMYDEEHFPRSVVLLTLWRGEYGARARLRAALERE